VSSRFKTMVEGRSQRSRRFLACSAMGEKDSTFVSRGSSCTLSPSSWASSCRAFAVGEQRAGERRSKSDDRGPGRLNHRGNVGHSVPVMGGQDPSHLSRNSLALHLNSSLAV
jgi:hypothetical protein